MYSFFHKYNLLTDIFIHLDVLLYYNRQEQFIILLLIYQNIEEKIIFASDNTCVNKDALIRPETSVSDNKGWLAQDSLIDRHGRL